MSNTLLAVLTLVWPPVAIYLTLKLLPSVVGRFLEKEIERRSDARLARTKAEIEGSFGTLKTSVDVLAASSTGMRSHVVESVSALWATLLALKERVSGVTTFDAIFLAEEAADAFANPDNPRSAKALEFVRPVQTSSREIFAPEAHANELELHRLFVGERLWLTFYVIRAVLMRSALLMAWSFEKRQFHDWRKDGAFEQLVTTVVPRAEFVKATEATPYALTSLISRLEGEFLHEATRVMSGSKSIADSLAGMQTTLLLEHAKLAGVKGK